MSGYVIYGIKYTKGNIYLIKELKFLDISLTWENAIKRQALHRKQYTTQENKLFFWDIKISEELSVY